MKLIKIVLFWAFAWAMPFPVQAQVTDPYEIQRQKVNSLLEQRSANFGQYDQSLAARTGIFGFQTKKDVQNSNEILRQIVLNDNDIFRELKVLLDYKNVASDQLKDAYKEKDNQLNQYRSTIKKLQDQNEILKIQAEKSESSASFNFFLAALMALFLLGLTYVVYRQRKLIQNN